MPDTTTIQSLPLIQPSQAQKHVTHNEALKILDVLTQLSVVSRNRAAPPVTPVLGEAHIVGAGATAADRDGERPVCTAPRGALSGRARLWTRTVTSDTAGDHAGLRLSVV